MEVPYESCVTSIEILQRKGGDIMNLDITQDNLYLILPSKVSRMAEMLADDNGISIIDAVKQVYASEVYQRLEQESTKQWHLGPVALYQEMRG
jgi:hypothetical protein